MSNGKGKCEMIFLGCKIIWNKVNDQEDDEEEVAEFDDDTLASIDDASLSIFCGTEERLKVNIDMTSTFGEIEFQSLGKFYIYDEVAVVLSADSIEAHNILDKIAVPVICLDKTKPSDLTLEELDRIFTITFQILPPPPAEFHDEQSCKTSRKARIVSIGQTAPSSHTRNAQEISNSEEANSILSDSRQNIRRKNQLFVRLSDIYSLIRSMIVSLGDSVHTASIAVETIHLLTRYIYDASRITVLVIMDLGMESIKAVDATIFDSLTMLDDSVDHYRTAIVDCLRSVFQRLAVDVSQFENHAQEAIAGFARPWIRFPIRMTRPLLNFAINNTLPVYNFSKPYLIDPNTDRIMAIRNRVADYPIVGSALLEAEKVLNFTLNEVKDELQIKQNK